MAYVIAEPCEGVCDTACVDACPVDAIGGPIALPITRGELRRSEKRASLQLFIDPEVCICCGACEPVCPVSAIFEEDALPPAWGHYRERNAANFADR